MECPASVGPKPPPEVATPHWHRVPWLPPDPLRVLLNCRVDSYPLLRSLKDNLLSALLLGRQSLAPLSTIAPLLLPKRATTLAEPVHPQLDLVEPTVLLALLFAVGYSPVAHKILRT